MVPDKAQHNPCCEKGNCQPLPTEHPSSSNADGVDLNNCTICSKVEVLVMKNGMQHDAYYHHVVQNDCYEARSTGHAMRHCHHIHCVSQGGFFFQDTVIQTAVANQVSIWKPPEPTLARNTWQQTFALPNFPLFVKADFPCCNI